MVLKLAWVSVKLAWVSVKLAWVSVKLAWVSVKLAWVSVKLELEMEQKYNITRYNTKVQYFLLLYLFHKKLTISCSNNTTRVVSLTQFINTGVIENTAIMNVK